MTHEIPIHLEPLVGKDAIYSLIAQDRPPHIQYREICYTGIDGAQETRVVTEVVIPNDPISDGEIFRDDIEGPLPVRRVIIPSDIEKIIQTHINDAWQAYLS